MIKLKYSSEMVEISYEILSFIKNNNEIPNELIERYFKTPGFELLIKHLKHYGNFELKLDYLGKCFETVNSGNKSENIFVKNMMVVLNNIDKYNDILSKLDVTEITEKSIRLANQYLPMDFEGDFKVYFALGIRGTSIVLGNEILVGLCDFSLEENGELNLECLIKILAHEIHHIAFDDYVKALYGRTNEREHSMIYLLGEVLSEGIASYYLTNPNEKNILDNSNWINNKEDINVHLQTINQFLSNMKNGGEIPKEKINDLFDDSLIGYSVGLELVEKIHKKLGFEKVLDCVKDCRKVTTLYNQAVDGEIDNMKFDFSN